MNIDAKDLILGRLAAYAAKQALLGSQINIVNCDKAAITGSKENISQKYKERRARGTPFKGPFFPRVSERIVKRAVKGMLPHKQERGKKALKRVKCYFGIPEALNEQKFETIQRMNILNSRTPKFIYVGDLAKLLGRK